MMSPLRIATVIALAALAASAASLRAQAFGLGAPRLELEARAEQLEQMAASTAEPAAARAEAGRGAALIRRRLSEGDFKVGDRILLVVEGEPSLSDTFTVGLGAALTLPGIGALSLAGVLRSELQTYLTARLGQHLRDPVVEARAYVRLSIQGAVARPGFYGVPAAALLSDALMAAGGTTAEADIGKLRIERGGRRVWEGKALQQAIAGGKTIDEAGLVAGDQYVMPRRGGRSAVDVLRFGGYLLTIPVTIYTLTKIF